MASCNVQCRTSCICFGCTCAHNAHDTFASWGNIFVVCWQCPRWEVQCNGAHRFSRDPPCKQCVDEIDGLEKPDGPRHTVVDNSIGRRTRYWSKEVQMVCSTWCVFSNRVCVAFTFVLLLIVRLRCLSTLVLLFYVCLFACLLCFSCYILLACNACFLYPCLRTLFLYDLFFQCISS